MCFGVKGACLDKMEAFFKRVCITASFIFYSGDAFIFI